MQAGLPNVGMYTWSIDGVPADCKVLKYVEFVESEPLLGLEFAYSPAQHEQASSLDIGQLCKLHRQSILEARCVRLQAPPISSLST